MYAHRPEHVQQYGTAVTESFHQLRGAIDSGTVTERLRGPVAHSGFQRLA
jgi:glutamate-1-semialdehyde 2,1-aminomutase